MSGDRHLVFVYGTLKTGQPNHHVLEERSNGEAKLNGQAKTVEKFPLVIANQFNTPYLLDAKGTGKVVSGELLEVDDKMFTTLDRLESHPFCYTREHIHVTVENDSVSPVECWAYILKDFKPELLNGNLYDDYDSFGVHGLEYTPRSRRPKEVLEKPQTVWAEIKYLNKN